MFSEQTYLATIRTCIVWRNPKYADQLEQPRAPEETGVRVGTWARGKDSELRLSIDEFRGNTDLALRVWTKGGDGVFWPTQKGCSIRLSEAEDVADAIAAAVHQARQDDGQTGRTPDPARSPARAQQRRSRTQKGVIRSSASPWESVMRPSQPPALTFSEFD